MSRTRQLVFSLAFLLAVASVASAQRGRGRVGVISPVDLVSAESIQTEIKLNDQQKQAVDELRQSWRAERRELWQARGQANDEEAREKMQKLSRETEGKLKDLLEEKQAKRLGEIFVQVNGVQSVAHPLVAEALSISDEQQQQMRELNREAFAAIREASQELQGATPEEIRERMGKFRDETNNKLMAKLTDEQKEKLNQLKGEPFEFDRSQLRRGRRNRS